jgi:hypothetical protein
MIVVIALIVLIVVICILHLTIPQRRKCIEEVMREMDTGYTHRGRPEYSASPSTASGWPLRQADQRRIEDQPGHGGVVAREISAAGRRGVAEK